MSIKAMKEERFEIFKRLEELRTTANDAEHKWCDEDESNWTSCNGDYDRLSRSIEITERTEELEQKLGQQSEKRELFRAELPEAVRDATPSKEERDEALQGWARHQMGMDLEERHQLACRKCAVNPKKDYFEAQLYRGNYEMVRREMRAQSTTDAAGGYLIPEGFVFELERALLAYGGMRQVSSTIRTSDGADLPWPTVNDTSNKGAILAENAAVSEQDVVFGSTTLQSFKYTSKLVLVSEELMISSFTNFGTILGSLLGERVARILNEHFTTGSGSGQPSGIVSGSISGKTAASASAITAGEIIDLFHSVDPMYRESTSSVWMMNDSSIAAVRKLTDDQGQFLWQSGMQAGIPDRLYGRAVVVNQDVADIGAGTFPIIFGDFSLYKIRDVAGVRLYRLGELYRASDQTGFVIFSSHDGTLLNAGTNPVKYLTMAAS
jgi:HK97 family phage major capsid protein